MYTIFLKHGNLEIIVQLIGLLNLETMQTPSSQNGKEIAAPS